MKFTEGYWLRSERANALYAMQVYTAEEIPNGLRIIAPAAKITGRAATVDQPTLTMEFTSAGENIIRVKGWHFEAYNPHEARFDIHEEPQPVKVEINENEAILYAGNVSVHVTLKDFGYRFEAEGKVLTSCGFRNFGYIRWNRQPSTMFPEPNYLSANYDPYMVNELSLEPGECVYGLGERFTAFVKNGQVVETWNEDGGTASEVAYKCIPFYQTSRGYGILVDHTTNVSFEIASEKVEDVGFSVPGEELRYYFIYGPEPKDVIHHYTELTGRPALPPAWSFGLWLSTSFTTNYSEETTSSFIQGMADRGIPLSVFHFDCFWMREFHLCDFEWDKRVFPDVKGMLSRYHSKGLHLCVWLNPYIAQGTHLFTEAVKGGYLIQRADGKGPKQLDNWESGMGIVDFTNPAAKTWYLNKLRNLLEMGIDVFKTDFGERIPIDVKYFDGSDPVSMHNKYTYLYNKSVFELLEEVRGKKDAVVFARSATVGSQQFPVHWGGDCSASYSSMAETLRGGLSFMMSGFSFWSHDISGFEQTATPDVYKRWCAFGLLSTHSRLHGSTSYRVPWVFDDEASEVLKFFTHLKMRLMPYIYQKAVEAHESGIPVMRPMIMEFPHDPAVKYLDMQYMLGDKLLVAPVFNSDGEVDIYLPKGRWTHLISGDVFEGGQWIHEKYDYFSIGLFVRENTILPMSSHEDSPDYNYADNLTFYLYQISDKSEINCTIPDLKGMPIMNVKAVRNDHEITFTTSKLNSGMNVITINENERKETALASVKTELKI